MRGSKSAACRWIGLSVLVGLFTGWRVPQSPTPNIAANEATAISILREIAAAEARVKADVTIDTNCDGVGEYAYLAELAGTKAKRVCNGGVPEAGNVSYDTIHPPLIRHALGVMIFGAPRVAGYRFGMWLPKETQLYFGSSVGGLEEDWGGGKMSAPYPGSRNCAGLWCCYAWPERAGITGRRAFFMNQDGVLLQCANDGPNPFSGSAWSERPQFGEALLNSRDMASGIRVGIPGGLHNTIWTRVW
jgi:hypothetical protein